MDVLNQIKERVRPFSPRVVLPEPQDDRILVAAHRILEEGFARVIFLGREDSIMARGRDLGLELGRAAIVDIQTDPRRQVLFDELYERFKNRGRTPEDIEKLIADPIYYGAL